MYITFYIPKERRTMEKNVEQYAQVLLMAASLLDELNKKKNNPEVQAVANELRFIAEELLSERNELEKSKNLFLRLWNFIQNSLKGAK